MVSVIGMMSISTGGIIRLSKKLIELIGAQADDKLVILKTGEDLYTIQIQRDDEVIFAFEGSPIATE